ncbi:unnamed protein product, partial [Rotaria sordida]
MLEKLYVSATSVPIKIVFPQSNLLMRFHRSNFTKANLFGHLQSALR